MRLMRNLAIMAAAGCAASAYAQPTVINLSGASLLENFLNKPAATNDWLDCDGDGQAGSLNPPLVDQLAVSQNGTFGPNDWWAVQYRLAGSVAGYQELVSYGPVAAGNCASPTTWPGLFVTGNNALVSPPNVVLGDATSGPIQISGASVAYFNGVVVYNTTVTPPVFNPLYTTANPGGFPVMANLTTLNAVTGAPAAGGYRVDMAPVDVPSTWAVRGASGGSTTATATPGGAGYGRNARTSVNAQGTSTGAGFSYLLVDLGSRNLNTGAPDCNTIFDTDLFFAPIGAIVNYGAGLEQIDQSELRFLYGTGRLQNGENLVAATREIGSGTRNGFNNTTGIDPSWGVGDNIGGSGTTGTTGQSNVLGDLFVPNNKVGSGDMETTVRNHRLAVGYSGAERYNNARAQQYGLLAVRCDMSGGTEYGRPTLDNLLDNVPGVNSSLYVLGGPAILASVGDPRNETVLGGETGNTNPRMANIEAAKFINNISRSIENFVDVPANVNNVGMPGELAATLFIPTTARRYSNDTTDPTQLVVNPDFNSKLAGVLPQYSVLNNPPINGPFGGVTLDGQSPARLTGAGITYTDGVANGANYISQGGAVVTYNANLSPRNRIAGDFNGDGLRNLNDATEMLRAYRQRNGGPVWTAPNGTGPIAGASGADAVIEILGDFNGDGNFDAEDIRYWADGLAIDPATGKLDRKKGFEAIDNAWQTLTGGNNFFGTTITGGGSYAAGDSRFDVAGSGGIARGWAPVGADGVIDQQDADYIRDQFINNPFVLDGAANWDNLSEAVGFDLSADVTGDLIVNQADLDAVNAVIGGGGGCYANCDGSTIVPVLNVNDFVCFQQRFAAGDPFANCDGSTIVPVLNVNDFVCFQQQFAAGCP